MKRKTSVLDVLARSQETRGHKQESSGEEQEAQEQAAGVKVWAGGEAGHSQEGEKRLREVAGAEDAGPQNPFRELGVCPQNPFRELGVCPQNPFRELGVCPQKQWETSQRLSVEWNRES